MYRSHATAHHCVIANSFYMVTANSPPPSLKWKRRGWATEPLSEHSTMATHQNMAEWIDEKPSMSGADVSDSCTKAPPSTFLALFVSQNDPSLPPLLSFFYLSFMYVLFNESGLPAGFTYGPYCPIIFTGKFQFFGGYMVYDLHYGKDYCGQVSCAPSISQGTLSLFHILF